MNIRRNSIINLAGSMIGLALFAALTPLYYQVIGSERYGILSIIFAFMAFFTTFDFGMGASLTYRIAGDAREDLHRQSGYFWTALAISFPVGALIGGILFGLVSGGFGQLFRLSDDVTRELMQSMTPLLAIGMATVFQSTIGGLYKGREYFLLTAIFGALSLACSILLPVMAALLIGPSLHNLILASLASRLISLIPTLLIAYFIILRRARPWISGSLARNLLGYGSWMSVAGIAELIISSADRFLIGVTLGSAAVPFYVIPFSVVSRAMVFPNSLMGAVLPQMVSRGNDSDLSVKALDVLLLLTPLFLLGIMISPEFMRLWMGQKFADHATLSLQILGVAFWLEMVGSVMYFQILAMGKPKKNFLIAAATAPPYLALLYIFTSHWGVAGTSFAYLIKNLLSLAGRTAVIGSTRRVLHRIWLDASLLAIMLGICWMPAPDFIRIAAGLILLAVCIFPKMDTLKLYLLPYANRIRRAQPSGF